MKLRLLNGGHQALAYIGYLSGHRTVDQACADEVVCGFLERYMATEAAPTLPSEQGLDLLGYQRSLLERFANPHVQDTLSRLAGEGSDRISTFVAPVARDRLRSGGSVEHTALVMAAWARYAMGVDEAGGATEVVDRLLEEVRAAAATQIQDPTAVLRAVPSLRDLGEDPVFAAVFTEQLRALHDHGARAAAAALSPSR